jgi:site-specific recombinase XerD
MATFTAFPSRKCYRVRYTLTLDTIKKRRAKYAPIKSEAQTLAQRLTHLEQATRTGIASHPDIEDWIQRGWITADEADRAFVGYSETPSRTRGALDTDYDNLLRAYEEYSERNTKDAIYRKSHGVNMGRAKKVIGWFSDKHPDLASVTVRDVEQYLDSLRNHGYAPWTISHFMTVLRILLDHAVRFDMIEDNPARKVKIRQPKRVQQRRVLDRTEIDWLLEASLNYPQWINGSLPTLVRLGLYAGLRNQEMLWLKWDAIDWNQRILTIGRSCCEITGEVWVPKDHEMRRLDVKEALIRQLQEERRRQKQMDLLGPFVMPGGGGTRPEDYRQRPLSPIALQRAFKRLLKAESRLDMGCTIYSLRHTYCTMLLRKPPHGAGLDIRTVQQYMGHSDMKTTMEYLHYLEPETHPTDQLPY